MSTSVFIKMRKNMETSGIPNNKKMVILIPKNYPAIKIMFRKNFNDLGD